MKNAPCMCSECVERQLFIGIVQQYNDAAFRQKTMQGWKDAKTCKRTIAQSGTDECNLWLLCSGNLLHFSATGRLCRAANQIAMSAQVKEHEFTFQSRPIRNEKPQVHCLRWTVMVLTFHRDS